MVEQLWGIKHTTFESKDLLLEAIRDKRVNNIEQALKFENAEGLWFGPYSDIFDVLNAEASLGTIQLDKEEKRNEDRKLVWVEPQMA